MAASSRQGRGAFDNILDVPILAAAGFHLLALQSMKITLAPKVARLVEAQVRQSNKAIASTARGRASGSKTDADELVNELVWLALRTGDIRKGWK